MRKIWLSMLLFLFTLPLFGAVDTITGGAFQDPSGSVIANGSISFQLSSACSIGTTGQVVPRTTVTFALDSSGNIATGSTLWGNDQCSPSGTFYTVTIYDASGQIVRGPENWVIQGVSPISLGTIVAASGSVSYPGAVDLTTNQTVAGNKTFTGTTTHSGPTINTGTTTLTSVNNTVLCDQSSGANFAAKVNACIATVIAQGGGIADATGLLGAQTGSVAINVGTNTVSGVTGNHISVTLLLSPYLFYTSSLNSAGACAIQVFDESRVIGTIAGITHSAIVTSGVGVTAGSLLCDNFGAGTGQYVAVQGVQFYNPSANGSTYTNGLVFIKNAFDESSISDLMISNQGGIGLHVEATCCGTHFSHIISDGNSAANSVPLQIDSLTGDLQPVLATVFEGISVDHPGITKNNIIINNTYASTTSPCAVSFTGTLYMEGTTGADTTTPLFLDNGCTLVEIEQAVAQLRAAASTAHAISIAQPAGIVPILRLGQGVWQNSGLSFPAVFLDDNYRGATASTDNQGVLNGYSGGQALSLFQQIQLFGYARFVETADPAAAAGADICDGNNTTHTLKCSYNNGSFFTIPQTIASGTATMTTALIATVACGTTVTVAATGVLTTDVIDFDTNAAVTAANNGLLRMSAWPTAGNVNFNYCNPTAAGVTPTATTVNWSVRRP